VYTNRGNVFSGGHDRTKSPDYARRHRYVSFVSTVYTIGFAVDGRYVPKSEGGAGDSGTYSDRLNDRAVYPVRSG